MCLVACPLGSEKPNKGLIPRTLPSISVFASWGSENPHFFQSSVNTASNASILDHSYANPDILRAEGRARSSVRASLSSFKDYLTRNKKGENRLSPEKLRVASNINRDDTTNPSSTAFALSIEPMKEHIELRGYLPIAAQLEV
jgi:hypothetical protein